MYYYYRLMSSRLTCI